MLNCIYKVLSASKLSIWRMLWEVTRRRQTKRDVRAARFAHPLKFGFSTGFSRSGISLIWTSGFEIVKQNRGEIRDWKYAQEVNAQNNPQDYGIARNFGSGLQGWRTPLGMLSNGEVACRLFQVCLNWKGNTRVIKSSCQKVNKFL